VPCSRSARDSGPPLRLEQARQRLGRQKARISPAHHPDMGLAGRLASTGRGGQVELANWPSRKAPHRR
jgi:hypothetical protein